MFSSLKLKLPSCDMREQRTGLQQHVNKRSFNLLDIALHPYHSSNIPFILNVFIKSSRISIIECASTAPECASVQLSETSIDCVEISGKSTTQMRDLQT